MLLKRITILIIFACFFITSCDDENKTSLGSFDLAIENVKLFDGENIFENVSLFIKDDKIDRIIINNESMYEASSVISGAGKTIAPGLIDAHVHLENEEDLSIAAESGVLTLLDLGIFDTVKAGELRQSGEENSSYAYYYSAGILVSCQGGIWSGKLNSIGIDPLSDGSDVPSYIQDRVNEGSDFIKLMLDPGKNNNFTVVSDEMIQSCINEAHGQGLNCYVHAVRVEDALKAAEYGADGLTHIWFRNIESASSEDLEEIKNSGMFIIPTAHYMIKDYGGQVAMSPDVTKTELINIYNAGIPIVAGTDAYREGSGNMRHNINYGSGLVSELELYVEVGIPELEALRSATMNPSKYFDLGTKGYIKEGYPADFFLVNGDPTSNISDLRKVAYVWKQGVQIVP